MHSGKFRKRVRKVSDINIPPQVSPEYRGGQEQVQLTES